MQHGLGLGGSAAGYSHRRRANAVACRAGGRLTWGPRLVRPEWVLSVH